MTAQMYAVITDHADGSRAVMDYLTLGDVLAVIGGLDNLAITECSISPADDTPAIERAAQYRDWEADTIAREDRESAQASA